jgi:hypothetical protein
LAERPFAVTIRPVVSQNQPRGPAWQLHGTIKSRVTADPLAVDFGERSIHGGTTVTQTIRAAIHVPSRGLEVVVNPDIATATVHRREDDETKFDIILAANPDLPPGEFKAEAQIKVVAPTRERWPGFTVPIGGKMQPEVRLLPSRLLLDAKPVGETTEAIVTLQAPPDSRAVVDHIETDSPGLQIEPVAIEGIPMGCAFRVRQRVMKEGEQSSTVRFVIRKPGQEMLSLPVGISYRGKPGQKVAKTAEEEKQP